jgi:hypothetical protein
MLKLTVASSQHLQYIPVSLAAEKIIRRFTTVQQAKEFTWTVGIRVAKRGRSVHPLKHSGIPADIPCLMLEQNE